jgi:hypothetical protein
MKTLIVLCLTVLLVGCSDSKPIVDIQQSMKPGMIQMDIHHCIWMAKYYDLDVEKATERCLKGRGHVYLGFENRD